MDSGWITSQTFEHSFKNDLAEVTSLGAIQQTLHKNKFIGKLMEKLIRFLTKLFGENSRIVSILGSSGGQVSSNKITKIFTVKLIIRDDKGKTSENTTTLQISYYTYQNQPPIASFTYSPQNPTTSDTIHFYDQSTDTDGSIVSWYWNFGDGSTSTQRNPTHRYSSPGRYTVTLKVKDDKGATDTYEKTITVKKPVTLPKVSASTTEVGATFAKIKVTLQSDGGDDCDIYLYIRKEGESNYQLRKSWYNKHSGFSTTYKVTGLSSGTTYYYYVKAVNSKGGTYTSVKSFTTASTCFLAGTKILMADGSYKNIEDVKVGDIVKAYDIQNGRLVDAKVSHVYHHPKEAAPEYYIVINGVLKVTPNHPVYVNGKWLPAEEIRIGDKLQGVNGEEIKVTSIQKVFRKEATYNLEIEIYHNYFADNILVHNKSDDDNGGSND